MAVSIALQVLCVAAMLIWPLLAAPGALPPIYIVTPVPPYRGGGPAEKARPRHMSIRRNEPQLPNRLTFPTANAIRRADEPSQESASAPSIDIPGPGTGPGPIGDFVPGGDSKGWPIHPPQPGPPSPLIHKSEGVMAGALVHRIDPSYPEIARDMHLTGTVRLQAIIGTNGAVQNLQVLSGNPILTRAAVAAVRQWRYRPTLLNGAPVEVETYITVNFVLSQ